MDWQIIVNSSARRQIAKLPRIVNMACQLLLLELKKEGPIRKNWPNFGSLGKSGKSIPRILIIATLRRVSLHMWLVGILKIKNLN